ncbi:ankyrin repeat domain-containing protein 53 [Fukomys damarensis]|uniref:ankyrin repeat domain-containing protein 53 n=1 Tax=Fukomys damarensis TaxID=885580 RepID=UPI0008FF6AF1|nr:ankyrin repeat domain-containing protein 53 [Fukomys damarensis]
MLKEQSARRESEHKTSLEIHIDNLKIFIPFYLLILLTGIHSQQPAFRSSSRDDAPRGEAGGEAPAVRPRAPAQSCSPAATSVRTQTGTLDPGEEERRGVQPGSRRRADKAFLKVTPSDLETTRSSASIPESSRNYSQLFAAAVGNVEWLRFCLNQDHGGAGRLRPLSPTCADSSASIPESSRNYSQLFAAAVGNVEWLRFCLNQDHGEIQRDRKGFTAIHFAAQRGKLACMKVLIEEYKVPVDLPTYSGQTPLHLVMHKDNKTMAVPCILYLLKKGASINSRTGNGFTPLHLAAQEGLLGCMKTLVQSGANVRAQDATGCKPIDYCKIWNHRACARFLKDAMWKQDKKDFACEMRKLKRLKDQLTLMEQNYLLEYQKEHQLLREEDFRKWLHRKLLQSSVSNRKQEAGAPTCPSALCKTPGSQISKSFYRFVEARLKSTPQPKVPPKPIYRQPKISRPKLWNLSNNPARSCPFSISCPQDIRLGVHPDPCQEHDFRNFVEVTRNAHGGAQLRTVDGHWVAPIPQLPFEVMVRMLHPGVRPYRMKVPQGFCVKSILDIPQRRHPGQDTFWTDTMAMNLRETFDKAFLASMQAHGGLPALPSSPAAL